VNAAEQPLIAPILAGDRRSIARAITAVERTRAAINIPQHLRELGVKREQLPGFAEKAFAIKRLMNTNPRRPTQADLLAILEEAF